MSTRRTFLGSLIGAGALLRSELAHAAANAASHAQALRRSGFEGTLVVPGDPEFDSARRTFVYGPRITERPRVIAYCAGEDDIRRTLDVALRERVEFSVRSGGHDLLAASCSDGIVVDVSRIDGIQVDREGMTVDVGAGARAGALNAALGAQGLAAALGCDARIGVSGLTLGGGLGWFAGRFGAACDNLLEARVVLADGRLVRAGDADEPDLLWALRGGGGNFGIVSRLKLRVHPLPDVHAGTMLLRPASLADFVVGLGAYLGECGDLIELETFVLPGREGPVVLLKACHSGTERMLSSHLARIGALGNVLAHDVAARKYTGVIEPSATVANAMRAAPVPKNADDRPGFHVASVGLAPISSDAARALAAHVESARGRWAVGIAHSMHGAVTQVPGAYSPMIRPDGHVTVYFASGWRRATDAAATTGWVDAGAAALRPFAGSTYVNYMTSTDPDEVRRAYGPNFGRLAAIKRRFDPDNVFHRNRNIEPGRGT